MSIGRTRAKRKSQQYRNLHEVLWARVTSPLAAPSLVHNGGLRLPPRVSRRQQGAPTGRRALCFHFRKLSGTRKPPGASSFIGAQKASIPPQGAYIMSVGDPPAPRNHRNRARINTRPDRVASLYAGPDERWAVENDAVRSPQGKGRSTRFIATVIWGQTAG